MGNLPNLWQATARKEVMDLLVQLWASVDDNGREEISEALLLGPGDDFLEDATVEERQASADRRVYERISVIERIGAPPLTDGLAARLADLRNRYPIWKIGEGERAHFASWSEATWGPNSHYNLDDLVNASDTELLDILLTAENMREGLLDAWRSFAQADPERAYQSLQALAGTTDGGPVDVWEYGLMGLRDASSFNNKSERMLALLLPAPAAIFEREGGVRAAVDVLEAASRELPKGVEQQYFWPLFDRVLFAIAQNDHEQGPALVEFVGDEPRTDWVSEAVNSSVGRLATAFFNLLFQRRPKAGEGLPEDLISRLDLLMTTHSVRHRCARVLAASRSSYLLAIDREWTVRNLIPQFRWSDEEEAIAMWQGYAWQARLDPELWEEIKADFIPLFQPERLRRIGNWARNLAQSLMLVGVAFGVDEIKRDDGRNAIRSLSPDLRADAAAWLAMYMEADAEDQPENEEPIEGDADRRWAERVVPWLKKVWPVEPHFQTPAVSEQFALAAIGTDKLFPNAVEFIRPYLIPDHSYQLLTGLQKTQHPENHPRATLDLIDRATTLEPLILFEGSLISLIDRIEDADQALADDNIFRKWREFLNQQ